MLSVWIVDRNTQRRGALERQAAPAVGACVCGAPGDPQFDAAAPPDVVILGLPARDHDGANWERELAFASRVRPRAVGAVWLLIAPGPAEPLARALFDDLVVDFLAYPPSPETLQARLARAAPPTALAPLSERRARDAVAARFARWFGDLDLPELLRALDPALAPLPVLIRGEPGSGRSVVVRYLHYFGLEGAVLVHAPCHEALSLAEIEALLSRAQSQAQESLGLRRGMTLWLEDAERLPHTAQRQLRAWLQGVAWPRGLRAPFARLVASTTPRGVSPALRPELAGGFGALQIELPALRERPTRIASIARETLADWRRAQRIPERQLADEASALLAECTWPGNLEELEAVLLESAVASSGELISCAELRFGGHPLLPLSCPAESAGPGEATEEALQPAPATPGSASPPEIPEPDALPVQDDAVPLAVPVPVPAHGPTPGGNDQKAGGNDQKPDRIAQLAAAFAREVRQPVAAMRALLELPAERFQDPAFRARLGAALERDSAEIVRLVDRIGSLGSVEKGRFELVDVAALLEELLAAHAEAIRSRQLLVLKELDSAGPCARADPKPLRRALEVLIDRAFQAVPARGDLYIASRHHPASDGADSLRVLLRFHSQRARAKLPALDQSLEILVAQSVIESMGGRVAVNSAEAEEVLILLDLPAAERPPHADGD